MKKKSIIVIIVIVVVLAGLIAGASILYKRLSKKVDSGNMVEFQTPSKQETNEEMPKTDTPADGTAMPEDQTQQGPSAAPNFVLTDEDGNERMLSDFFDKPVVLNFWASWCPPCREEMPDFDEMYKQYGDQINFIFVNLVDGSRETEETAKAFIEEQGLSFPIYFDIYGEGAVDYAIYYIPDTFFIDRNGNVIGYAVGGIDRASMEEGIGKLLE